MTIVPCLDYIAGAWVPAASSSATTPVFNPSTGAIIAACPVGSRVDAEAAIQAATDAFPAWRDTPPADRALVLARYRHLIEHHFDRLTALISREHGKTAIEAKGDLLRGIENIEYACGIPSLLMGDTLADITSGVDCETFHQPLGVCVGITPFNFPAMVPLWMFPLALVCGNTFVLKPSEKVPLTAIALVELLAEAGLPSGVLNLVHGGREVVNTLLVHPKVKAISFVGSPQVAKHIHEIGTRHGKRVQANSGAKSCVVIMPDADIPKTVETLATSAFGSAGERCLAGSAAIAVGAAASKLLPELITAAKAIKVGPTDRASQPHMGAVITAAHRDRVATLVATGESEGAKIVHDGRGFRVPEAPEGFYLGPTIMDDVHEHMTLAHEEVVGPVLNVLRMDDLDSAIETTNRFSFSNGAAIFTNNGRAAREFKHRIKAGMIGINIGVPSTMAMLPVAGRDDSSLGDLHLQGQDAILFYTRQKVVSTRWFAAGVGDS